MSALQMFIPITKVDKPRRLVYGVATAEAEDRAGEICDYATTKSFYKKWSEEIAESTAGKSFGNLRAMHGLVAAGKVTAITFNDEKKQIEICAKVVDDAEWAKVVEGVYTGFSQGGSYERRWTDDDGKTRYTAAPNEISLVDLPCLPEATFEMIKADGTTESRRFGRNDHAARLMRIAEELDWLSGERVSSSEDGELRNHAAGASRMIRAALRNRILEPLECGGTEGSHAVSAEPLKSPGARKIGARNNAEDQERVQRLHDMSIELGAACDTKKSMRGVLEKRFDLLAETLAGVLERLKKIEDQPLPLPFLGPARAISKAEEPHGEDNTGHVETLLEHPEMLSVLAIKMAQRKGRSTLR